MVGMITVGCVAAMTPAGAQMQPQAVQPPASEASTESTRIMDAMNSVQKDASEIQAKLNAAAQQAQEQTPEIQELHNKLMETYQDKLDEYGYPDQAGLQELRDIQQRLQTPADGEKDEAERVQLTQQFNTQVAKMQEAQEKAQSAPEVIAAQDDFLKVRSEAMTEVDPQVPALEQELEGLQSRIESLRQAMQQVQQQ